ncbi:MAG: glycosyltransferase family 2 protein [Candidatus Jacksonbacteria bacterium]|nr:glycosyltransferase family 2 protein [Candidatus Jacksonbacteria bacterium]MBT6034744.1 glycosyltransferase family 2 protein [Candidatus Jacksonbacteria bacterium]MBT6301082.1 glycosyltransferase family 2 protein [Candidatus Jacksonbacteria bacterium]MBT6757032.1 glycosyltransferase family 2 protein [Candidatus Jacksonbacteria bacterium]MBT6955507.1 glycosyltransferase family 2 protein [Candidatus Jacksonbacteria bacterium]
MPKVSVVIVSWNVKEHLKKCLQSFFLYYPGDDYEVIVVDNASNDGTGEMVSKEFPKARLFIQNKNLGFAKANNLGVVKAKAENILILNPDTEFCDNKLASLLNRFEKDKKVGVIGCRLLNTDKTVQASVRAFPKVCDQLIIQLKLHHIFKNITCLKKYWGAHIDYGKEQEVDQVMGAFMLVPRSVWDLLNGFDEKYFIWFEEVDFCKRAKEKGFKVLFSPTMTVVHHGGQSFDGVRGLKKQKWFLKSQRRYIKKFLPFWGGILHLLFSPISLFEAWFLQLIHGKNN